MAIRPGLTNGGPCLKHRASPAPRPKQKDHSDIKVTSHKQTVQHSVRAQKLDERQLSKFFKSLDDLKIKRLLQIDKEMSEQEQILENLANERELARERRVSRRGNSSRSTLADSDLSSILPDHFMRGPRPSIRRGSSNFDLYAFMMRRESDHAVSPHTKSTRVNKKTPRKSCKQVQSSPRHHKTSLKTSKAEDDRGSSSVAEYRSKDEYHVFLPGKYEMKPRSTSPVSVTSLARSVSIESLQSSTPNDDGITATHTQKSFPSGTDWPRRHDVNKGAPRRAHQRTPRSKQLQNARGDGRKRQSQKNNKREGGERRAELKVNAHDMAKTNGSLKKEVSFHFDEEEDKRDALGGIGVTIGAGIMEKNNLLKAPPVSSPLATNQPECKEPDCIFHNKAYRKTDHSDDDDYTIDDYYRTVGAKSTVSPLFMPAGSPRSWSRRGVVRPPSPNPSEFLHGLDHGKTTTDSSKGSLAESSSFLSVRRPLKGSNRERMLKDKEENVRTTFNLMRKKMADQKPPEFNQNYGTPTPNWKILNPLKMRHKINQSNPLHSRWGL
ncbi:uncharacterized protein LOC119732655 [Patiria miniata]|uniref:Uncharacterized protein n=1 Tax=Patiria miniata TaxID=46514 RepID=A0A914AFR1_PATMI|nr:uncharacterized protein LOC119732655 [Patiria miniata]